MSDNYPASTAQVVHADADKMCDIISVPANLEKLENCQENFEIYLHKEGKVIKFDLP